MSDNHEPSEHLTTDSEWAVLIEPVPTGSAARKADTQRKWRARHDLRNKLRDRAGRRLNEMFDNDTQAPTSTAVASWESYLNEHGSKAKRKPTRPQPERDDAVPITLRRDEVRLGVHEMFERQFRYAQMAAEGAGTSGRYGTCDDIIEGTIAELAAAKALGLYWHPSVGVQTTEVDVGGVIEVKHKRKAGEGLKVSAYSLKRAHPSRPFVLVVGTAPHYSVVGWLFASEIEAKGERPFPNRRLVPQPMLEPITRAFARRVHEHAPAVTALPVGSEITAIIDSLSEAEWETL